MSGPAPAVALVRHAVREFFGAPGRTALLSGGQLCVAVSGGADSLALAEAAAHVGHRLGVRVRALVVDHRLQDTSAEVAAAAAAAARKLGVDDATVLPVTVDGPGGPEAAARRARYAALREAAGQAPVLLGHTRDDQAETVLLGLGRGSGPRSVSGMRPLDPPWVRPLLDVPRSITREACEALGVRPWADPHNEDPRFTRVRLRSEVLPLLEDVLSGGVAAALARTAAQLREDSEALDQLADELLLPARNGPTLDIEPLLGAPAALRRRALRRWLLDLGARDLTDAHLRAVDALISAWRGQGPVWLPGRLEAKRAHGRLAVGPPGPSKGE
ncbi:tRNA lysidine(34) synthetase TilS [Amycolatopsis suaedae]|uniref:tRNA(Ile)-lysidine synthase n=1 Tax=Amycolatopsis suaedae TaxID=2510978 RepID=A0A4Q7J6K4_9PSEU|nr:tRNA lysidine(34) synthetase TilS [Amycolatopsis suaedae]RZQ61634.1 tRNA lysidine(34) synthetase TilS [Amycolatopsis suaedae]